jgi:hypothetical protein
MWEGNVDAATIKKSESKETSPGGGLSLDDLTKATPLVAIGFALAFEVGYFYSIDIGWFSFFTLSEHIEFALRALPIAIAGTVLFLLLLFMHELKMLFKTAVDSWLATLGELIYFAQEHCGLCVGVFVIGTTVVVTICSKPIPPIAETMND